MKMFKFMETNAEVMFLNRQLRVNENEMSKDL